MQSQQQGAIAFRDEIERRKTFEGLWRDECPVSPETLVQAGFYYCGPGDTVQCAWCYNKLMGWEEDDDPLTEHKRHFPACPKFGDSKSVDVSSLVNIRNSQGDSGMRKLSVDDLGILTVRPCNPQFAIEASRLESYGAGQWPSNLPQTPQLLSSAGFYYVGHADNVKCFFCDGGLSNWEANDDPWTEHARWFPNCGFLKQVMGTNYIQKVQDVGVNGGPVKSDDDVPEGRTATTSAPIASTSAPTASTSVPTASTSAPTASEAMAADSSQQRSWTNEQEKGIRAAMSSPLVDKALEAGIPKEAIKITVQERWLSSDGHFRDDKSLIDAAHLVNDRLAARAMTLPQQQDADASPGPSSSKKRRNKETTPPPPPTEMAEKNEEEAPEIPGNVGADPHAVDAKFLEEEYMKFRKQRMCKICMDEEVSIVLLPCGHLVSCARCAPALKNCPICRNGIKGTVRTFMA